MIGTVYTQHDLRVHDAIGSLGFRFESFEEAAQLVSYCLDAVLPVAGYTRGARDNSGTLVHIVAPFRSRTA